MFCLSGVGSSLSADIFPPYDTSDGEYVVGLVNLSTFNSIPNIERDRNDKLHLENHDPIVLPEGSYELEKIKEEIERNLPLGVTFELIGNHVTLKTEIKSNVVVDFTRKDSIGSLLGFSEKKLQAGFYNESDRPVNISSVETIRVECNIVRGSFDNGKESHIVHEFFPTVAPGYKIVETPSTVIYLPVNVRKVTNITVQLRDQKGSLINLRGETLSVRLHLKRSSNGAYI